MGGSQPGGPDGPSSHWACPDFCPQGGSLHGALSRLPGMAFALFALFSCPSRLHFSEASASSVPVWSERPEDGRADISHPPMGTPRGERLKGPGLARVLVLGSLHWTSDWVTAIYEAVLEPPGTRVCVRVCACAPYVCRGGAFPYRSPGRELTTSPCLTSLWTTLAF